MRVTGVPVAHGTIKGSRPDPSRPGWVVLDVAVDAGATIEGEDLPALAQGADVLLEHTVTGYKAMPPLGACMDCDEEQFRALIAHLAGVEAQP